MHGRRSNGLGRWLSPCSPSDGLCITGGVCLGRAALGLDNNIMPISGVGATTGLTGETLQGLRHDFQFWPIKEDSFFRTCIPICMEKEVANQGFRPRILDWFIFAHDACGAVRDLPDWDLRGILVLLSRGFTSDSQLAIEPRNLFTNMEKLRLLLLRGEFMEVCQNHKNLVAARAIIENRKKQRSTPSSTPASGERT